LAVDLNTAFVKQSPLPDCEMAFKYVIAVCVILSTLQRDWAVVGQNRYFERVKSGEVPDDALEIGVVRFADGNKPPLIVYAGRVNLNGKYYIGKFFDPSQVPWTLYANVNRKERTINSEFEVLTDSGSELTWKDSSTSRQNNDAVSFSPDGGKKLCRAMRNDGNGNNAYIVGEILKSTNVCFTFWYYGQHHNDYQALTRKGGAGPAAPVGAGGDTGDDYDEDTIYTTRLKSNRPR